jgi:hypothetical protein
MFGENEHFVTGPSSSLIGGDTRAEVCVSTSGSRVFALRDALATRAQVAGVILAIGQLRLNK